jgi:5'-nucleotidase
MDNPLKKKLVIAVASSAIFDLSEADSVFQNQGQEAYRKYTLENENNPFFQGPGFSFIQRLLSVNNPETQFEPIEVVLLSKNDAFTGNRVYKSLEHYGLSIGRAAFTCGSKPYPYIKAFQASLFLSANEKDVKDAVQQQMPAGIIMAPQKLSKTPDPVKPELKIAFDFDGIIVDDSSEQIFLEQGLDSFQNHEQEHSAIPLPPGPLQPLLKKISAIQLQEFEKQKAAPHYKARIRTAIITARKAPAHDRVIRTLRHWNIHVDEAFFLGGVSKAAVLSEYSPHIFFDDQRSNLTQPTVSMAMVHVPYGVVNN